MMNEMTQPGFYYTSKGCFVAKTSPFSGKFHNVYIPMLDVFSVDSWLNGEKIQHAMSYLSPDQREYVKTGITPEEWDAKFA